MERQSNARTFECGQSADRALLRHAHRPDLVLQDVVRRRAALRLARAPVALPGPEGTDGVGISPRLRRNQRQEALGVWRSTIPSIGWRTSAAAHGSR